MRAPSPFCPQNAPVSIRPTAQTLGTLFGSSGMLTHVNHPPSLFLGYSFPPPETTVPLPSSCTLLPRHEWCFLILSGGPTSQPRAVTRECKLWHFLCVVNSCSSLPELELKTQLAETAVIFLFSFQLLAKRPPFTSDSPPRRRAQKELTSLSPCFEVSCFDTAKTLHTAMQRKSRG